ncbi:MAG: PAS domain-containing protein, partial [Planctomycetales bacterium]|nr:PAS domain-containing protein [Planctomycetales bacterium]
NSGDAPLVALRNYLLALGEAYQKTDCDRARAEVRSRRMATQNDQMRSILEGLPEPVVAVDQYDELMLANSSARKLFHLPEDDGERQALKALAECKQLLELLGDSRRRRSQFQRETELQLGAEGDQQRWYNATIAPVAVKAGAAENEPTPVVAVLRDVSEQKEIQRRHAEFVSSVSHEMKTPLAGIKAYVELLADGDAEDEAEQEQFLEVINGQADRLQRLIDNLLNIARIEAGVVTVNKQPQSLNEVLEEAFRVVEPTAQQKHIALASELSSMHMSVLIDRDMILQSAINLLSNAIKYTPEDGQVTLRSRTAEGQVVFEVQDTGVGLCPEDCQKVFGKFYRVKKNAQMAGGTGLGLPLAKHIVEDVHRGQLTVESVEGAGSTFRVTLPRVNLNTAV